MFSIWHDQLYTPLLNLLIFLYTGPAGDNLGWAVVQLTVLLRLVLLPLSILDERNKFRYEKLDRHVEAIERDFKGDHIRKKEKIRELLKVHRVNYWSRVIVLGVQLIVLILLYQVFVGGIKFTPAEQLYSWVHPPILVNTVFFGTDLASHSAGWAAAVGLLLFATIYMQQRKRVHLVTRSDVMYLLFFPLFTFLILMLLPMVKTLFVLASMLFSILLTFVRRLFWKVPALKPYGTPPDGQH